MSVGQACAAWENYVETQHLLDKRRREWERATALLSLEEVEEYYRRGGGGNVKVQKDGAK